MKWFGVLILLAVELSLFAQPDTEASRTQAVEASAQIQESPARITLVWPARSDALSYKIHKRTAGGSWSEVANLGGGATSWADSNVQVGQRYEYRIAKATDRFGGWGYVTAGIKAAPLEDAGKVLLLVQDNIASALGPELERFRTNLILEGWEVIRQNVTAGSTPPQVKDFIRGQYNADPSRVKAVILLGHVAVPYSGNIFPDGHTNHTGAWPADVYYGEMHGNWTDTSVNSRIAERQVNWNVPGDGKFDQGALPSPVDLAVGRIDFYEMTCFANKTPSRSEIDLTRAYLNKNHAFRSGQWNLARRGMIIDNFGLRDTNGVAATGWRNFAAFFGSANVQQMDLNTYFPRMRTETALWSWGAGGGSYYYSSGVGTSDDFALNEVQVAFTLWLGSYFGDWNNESNWLKAALGSGKILTSIYSGLPHTFLHGMALGEAIGTGFVQSQNNSTNDLYQPDGQGMGLVHQALLGDPTLRMFPRVGVTGLSAAGGSGQATLNWTRPTAGDYVGAHIYRGSSANGPFTRVTSAPVAGTAHVDTVSSGTYAYLVRPVYLEGSGSGSFYNLGQGALAANVTVGGGNPLPPPGPIGLAVAVGRGTITVDVNASAGRGVITEWSGNFKDWNQVENETVPATGVLRYSITMNGTAAKFVRSRYSGNP